MGKQESSNKLVRLGVQQDHNTKTLGLLWDVGKDELGFDTTMPRVTPEVQKGQRVPMKREALKVVISVYDPLEVALTASKVKVAPLRPLSIPILELQTAVISCRLADLVRSEHRLQPISTTYWTDSHTVIQWIQSDARMYKPLVAHRLGEIDERTKIDEWKWLPSTLNVVEDAT
ncbi:hypothetical protein EVAR_11465_1 [Eumeta japonica]|uniref:Uncharacterized protein n=1 Tax=Eumeta variegata TaxID=151549 RepID=A0A4C1TNI3_EUMVA|nr:hypothetical protein EVAR_11465_1 [Eumeta japonica]